MSRIIEKKEGGDNPFQQQAQTEEYLDDFTKKSLEMADILNKMDSIVTDMQKIVASGDISDHNQECKIHIENYTKLLLKAKPIIEDLEKMNQALKGEGSRPLEYQKQLHLFQNMTRRLNNTMSRFSLLRESMSKMNLDKVKRTFEINGLYATENEIEDMIETNDFSRVETMAEISQKRENLQKLVQNEQSYLKLETQFKELFEIFNQLAFIIRENQEDIDRIETNVYQAHDYVVSANTKLEKAVQYKKSASKKKIYIIIAVVVILAIIIAAIAIPLSRKSGS
ncbi:hypothetical protein HZS_5102 [Henneguya salminicola]|uniref:Syntaxin-1A (Trinotate prediction) n=1 Tax=Henneguya salminicola TaxID=69463 RepID=A0A6G3MFP5_HENSL|nr:hypothetical protein HZS_5102 [Henneguya salminicola]